MTASMQAFLLFIEPYELSCFAFDSWVNASKLADAEFYSV